MQVKRFNFTATVYNASVPDVANLFARNHDMLKIIDYHPQWEEVAQPLISAWAKPFDGAFPPTDQPYRELWRDWNTTGSTLAQYDKALRLKKKSVEWYEQRVQYSTTGPCSDSILLYDIESGVPPPYREEHMNYSPDASFLGVVPDGTDMAEAGIRLLFGCADLTVPIARVPYYS